MMIELFAYSDKFKYIQREVTLIPSYTTGNIKELPKPDVTTLWQKGHFAYRRQSETGETQIQKWHTVV